MTWPLCPKCFRPVNPIGDHAWECAPCNIAGGSDTRLTPEQAESEQRLHDGQVKKVVGITIKSDPEYDVVKFLRWMYNFKRDNKSKV